MSKVKISDEAYEEMEQDWDRFEDDDHDLPWGEFDEDDL